MTWLQGSHTSTTLPTAHDCPNVWSNSGETRWPSHKPPQKALRECGLRRATPICRSWRVEGNTTERNCLPCSLPQKGTAFFPGVKSHWRMAGLCTHSCFSLVCYSSFSMDLPRPFPEGSYNPLWEPLSDSPTGEPRLASPQRPRLLHWRSPSPCRASTVGVPA